MLQFSRAPARHLRKCLQGERPPGGLDVRPGTPGVGRVVSQPLQEPAHAVGLHVFLQVEHQRRSRIPHQIRLVLRQHERGRYGSQLRQGHGFGRGEGLEHLLRREPRRPGSGHLTHRQGEPARGVVVAQPPDFLPGDHLVKGEGTECLCPNGQANRFIIVGPGLHLELPQRGPERRPVLVLAGKDVDDHGRRSTIQPPWRGQRPAGRS